MNLLRHSIIMHIYIKFNGGKCKQRLILDFTDSYQVAHLIFWQLFWRVQEVKMNEIWFAVL